MTNAEKAPVIAVSCFRERSPVEKDSVRTVFWDVLGALDAIPLPLPNVVASAILLRHCQGLLLTGGGDFDPGLFGWPDEGTDWRTVAAERDRTEMAAIHTAVAMGLPIMGICRGAQALAVARGGSLVQDIGRRYPASRIVHQQPNPRSQTAHPITIDASSRLARIAGASSIWVNSFHHQVIGASPPGWRVTARSPDGLIEAIEEDGDIWRVGVQWHPEDLFGNDTVTKRLFAEFIAAAQKRRS